MTVNPMYMPILLSKNVRNLFLRFLIISGSCKRKDNHIKYGSLSSYLIVFIHTHRVIVTVWNKFKREFNGQSAVGTCSCILPILLTKTCLNVP